MNKKLKVFILSMFFVAISCAEINNLENISSINHIEQEIIENYDMYIYIIKNGKRSNIEVVDFAKKYSKSEEQFYIMIGLFSVESKFDENANSFLGSKYGRGLGQISEIALEQYNKENKDDVKPNELYDIETNVKISCWIFNYYMEHYNLSYLETCMSYNKGYNGYKRNKEDIGYYLKIMNEVEKFVTI